ncbi:hypothetical protein K493DRAFT_316721 [Basidiobolus meristosporus CBS 931.73]|uniref:ABC transporter domain-containing protein n=2 Tax=Basidiobolus meristosporus CBS 931.73 TaxID=1314790 RepID=A0A1Y1Y2H9_9FUNG|nr:hypothetical protein K493DRAFT_316721 [Basidiobolus meristosporus CBS 931.73]|eukprot:ORX92222.1 hypothetical protein K493DRAFT_316721 [Basidiobolus meristosporus CBS 931.73]
MSEALHRPIEDPNSLWSSDIPTPVSFRNPDAGDEEITGETNFGENTNVSIDRAEETFVGVSRTLSRTPQDILSAEAGQAEFDLEKHLKAVLRSRKEKGVITKRLGLTFSNLSVYGESENFQRISTVGNFFTRALKLVPSIGRLFSTAEKNHKEILHNITGYCQTGELLLVLGRPGSGCSTLLRVLANQRKTYRKIDGEVLYGGIPAVEFGKRFKGQVTYNQEDDQHYPTLTVKQTLDFAIKCKAPTSKIVGDRAAFVDTLRTSLLSMFGLKGAANTIVGGAMVRGVSGGERKRVSIAEQMGTRSPISIWDGSTKGLDASSALDYVRCLRIQTDILGTTTVVTIYQASESIYELFDNVLLLHEGYCIYFGPANEAKGYFESIGFECPPRQTTADFLTGVTSMNERRVRSGFESKVPNTPEEYENCYKQSSFYQATVKELQEFEQAQKERNVEEDFRTAMQEEKTTGTSAKSPYTVGYFSQLKACLVRQFQLILGNKAALYFRSGFNILMAIIEGSVYFKLPLDGAGAFTRGGILFFSMLFNTLNAQAEIPNALNGRGVLYKHKSFALYRPSAFYIAQVVSDIPFNLTQITIFSCILYWMVGLHPAAGRFFLFILAIFLTSLTITAMFRMIAIFSKDLDSATRTVGCFILVYLLYTGYLIHPVDMHPWFKWIYYINPIGYGMGALLVNEFNGLVFSCSGTTLIPFGPSYNDIAHQVCTIMGSNPGVPDVQGSDYLYETFGLRNNRYWINIGALLGFWLLFIIITCVGIEVVEFGKGGYTTQVYKSRQRQQLEEDETILETNVSESEDAPLKQEMQGESFSWSHINYTVPVKGVPGGRQLLHDVSGWSAPGKLTALMGSSGAGKTTLLDVLAQRKTIGKVEGRILVGEVPQGPDFKRISGYCEQMDIHNPVATVREALKFSAYLRQPEEVSKAEKDAYVESIIKLLDMTDIADALIGEVETGLGISIEARKRLTIGLELVAKPKILFLDEPTSGLDSQASYNIVRFLRTLADEGQSIVCTIHQPSALLFSFFDSMLLLARGGKTIYFGPIGDDASILLNYFSKNGAEKCPDDANPAEYILDVIGAGVANKASKDWTEVWQQSPERVGVLEHVESIKVKSNVTYQREYATGRLHQLGIVFKRMLVSYWRLPSYNVGRFLFQIFIGIILGFTFYRLTSSVGDLQSRVFAIFQTTTLGILIITQVQPQLIRQRQWYLREKASGFYSPMSFAFSIILNELPYTLFSGTCFVIIFYWLVGLNTASDRAGFFYFCYVIFAMFAQSFGQMIAAFAPNIIVASMINPFFASMMALFCGVTIPYPSMPAFWKHWMYWLSPYHYFAEAVITNDLKGVTVYCTDSEFFRFTPPSGQTCGEYADAFLKMASGYLKDPNATDMCSYCQYRVGEDFYRNLAWDFSHRWRNFGILCLFTVFNLCAVVYFIHRYRGNR